MATIQSTGEMSNRERQVYEAYNDPDNGYISMLQKQIDQAIADTTTANNNLIAANAALTSLKEQNSTLKRNGFGTGDIAPIQVWTKVIGQFLGSSGNFADPSSMLTVPNPATLEAAASWINHAQSLADALNDEFRNNFVATGMVGFYNPGDRKPIATTNPGEKFLLYDKTFGKMKTEILNAISVLRTKISSYESSLLTAQSAVDTQTSVLEEAQEAYDTMSKIVKDLNKEMTALRLQFTSDMASAADTAAAATQQALQLQLASDPNYQAAVIAKQTADADREADLQRAELDAATELEKARIAAEAEANAQAQETARMTMDSSRAAAEKAAADKAEADKAASRKKTMWIIISIVAVVVIAVIAYVAWPKSSE